MPEYSDTPGRFPIPDGEGLGSKAKDNLPGMREGTIHIDGNLGQWIRPLLGEPVPEPGPDTFNFWWRWNGQDEPMCLLALTPDQVRRTIDVMREWLARNGG